MYGDDFVAEYLTIVGGTEPDVDQAFERWGVRWTILAPRDGLVRLLDKRPGWRRLYSDPYAVVQAKVDTPPQVLKGAAR
jgi:hypothetical protein